MNVRKFDKNCCYFTFCLSYVVPDYVPDHHVSHDMGNRLAAIDMGRKLGSVPLFGGAGSARNTMWPGPRPTSMPSAILIHPAVWPQHIWAENWGALPLWGGGAGSPSNGMWPRPRPTCMPSFILIHPTV